MILNVFCADIWNVSQRRRISNIWTHTLIWHRYEQRPHHQKWYHLKQTQQSRPHCLILGLLWKSPCADESVLWVLTIADPPDSGVTSSGKTTWSCSTADQLWSLLVYTQMRIISSHCDVNRNTERSVRCQRSCPTNSKSYFLDTAWLFPQRSPDWASDRIYSNTSKAVKEVRFTDSTSLSKVKLLKTAQTESTFNKVRL